MESFIFNSFKERMINGELSGNDVWTLQPVKKAFTEDYEDNLKYIRNETDLYYLNPSFNELGYLGVTNSFKDKYFTVMNPVHYNYSIMQNTDIAKQPEYVTKDNFDDFIANNSEEGNRILKDLFFDEENGKFYRPSDETELDPNGNPVPIPLGFYYVRTKEELRWCANLVNGEAYNNKINIVLGDNIGVEKTQTTLNFIIGENPNRPFEGIFYGNGYKFNNIELICDKQVNGIVGYLGTNGIISTIRVAGRNVLTCKSKITLEHLMSVGTDVAAGFICGKNNGVIEGIDFNAELVLYNFIPGICSVGNKSDSTLPAIEDNPMVNFCYPDYLCYNSLGNIVPYIGYFNEGVFATYDGKASNPNITGHSNDYHHYWKTLQFTDDIKGGYMFKHYTLDGEVYRSPQEWYYFAGVPYDNRSIDYYTNDNYIRNILFYDSAIFAKINASHFAPNISLQASKAGIVPINYADLYKTRYEAYSADTDVEYKEFYDYHKERKFDRIFACMPFINYLDKSIKMQQQNRVAYYVSPIIGINNREVKDVYVNCTAETSATFVGFLGGLAGKQNYGYITGCNVNLSSHDSLCTEEGKPNYYQTQLDKYNIFHERTIFNTEYTKNGEVEETYSFPLQSIKNIGGMFGSCIVGDTNSLIIKNCNIMFENQNAAVISSSDVSGIHPLSEDYYLLDRYAGIAAMMEFNTCNLSDIWATSADLANESTRCIKFENTQVTYREATGVHVLPLPGDYEFVQPFNVNDNKRFHSIINNIKGNSILLDDQPIYGIAAPLVGELKPTYIGSPSMLESLLPSDIVNYDDCTMGGQITIDPIPTPPPYQYYSLSYPYNTLSRYFSYNKVKRLNNMVGLFYMDQNIASPASTPAFYSDSLDVAIPGVKNISSGDNCNIMDHSTKTNVDDSYKAMSYRIDDVVSHIIDWHMLTVTNNHDIWNKDKMDNYNGIFKYTVIPSAAELPERANISNFKSYPEIYSNKYNKINYLYPYFGSDFVLNDTYVKPNDYRNKIVTGYEKYTLEIDNPYYNYTYRGDGDKTPRNKDTKFQIEVNLTAAPDASLDEKYTVYAIKENGDREKMKYNRKWGETIDYSYGTELTYVSPEIRTYGQQGTLSISIDDCWVHEAYNEEADIDWSVYNARLKVYNVIGCAFSNDYIKNNFFTLTCILTRYRDGKHKLYNATNTKLRLGEARVIEVKELIPDSEYNYILEFDNDTFNNTVNNIITTTAKPSVTAATYAGSPYLDRLDYGVYTAYWLQPDYMKVVENDTTSYYPIIGYEQNNTAHPITGNKDDWSAALITYVKKEPGNGVKINDSLTLYDKVDYYQEPIDNYLEPNTSQAATVSAYKFKVNEYSGADLLTTGIQVYKIIPEDATSYDTTYNYTHVFNLSYGQPNYNYHTWGGLTDHMSADFNDVFIYRKDGKFPYPISQNGTDKSDKYPKAWFEDVEYSGKYKLAVKPSRNNYQNKPISAVAFYDNYDNSNVSAYYDNLTANIKISDYAQHENDTLVDYFKYTYEKTPANAHINICSAGFKLPVTFDYKNNKAGFWFNMNESTVEKTRELKDLGPTPENTCSAYNDNIYYTSNVFAIGKTPNQSCIINEHLADPEITAVSFSSFSADDFEGIYVTDGNNKPVMYIDVGLGECPEGTTWSYSAYPSYSANIETALDTSAYNIIAETEEDNAKKRRLIDIRNQDVRNAINASGLILEVET